MKHLIPSNKNDQAFSFRGLLQQTIKKGILVLLLIISMHWAQAVTKTASTSGDWNKTATWGGVAPTASDDVVIAGGLTVTIPNGVSAVCKSLRIGAANNSGLGTLIFTGTSSLTVTNAITMGNALARKGTLTMISTSTLTCGSISDVNDFGTYVTNVGTINFTGTNFILPNLVYAFYNLNISAGTTSLGSNPLTIGNNLSISSGATLDLKTYTASTLGTGTISVSNGGTLILGGSGVFPAGFNIHSLGSTSTVEYTGYSKDISPLLSSQSYGNLIISGTGIKSLTSNIGIAGNLSINSSVLDLASFSANRISDGGTLTVADGATLQIGGTGTLPSHFSAHSININSTVEYNGGLQDVAPLNSGQSYGYLNLYIGVDPLSILGNKYTDGSKTLAGDVSVANTLSFDGLGNPNHLNIGNNTLTIAGDVLYQSDGASDFSCATGSNMIVTGSYDRTLMFDYTTEGVTNALNNLTISHNGYISSLATPLTVNNNLEFADGKLNLASTFLTIKGDIINTVLEGLIGNNTGYLFFNGAVSPTLSMDQTNPGVTNALYSLEVNSSSQVVTMGNDLQVDGPTTFTAGKLAINGNTLTVKGLVTNTVSGGIRAGSSSKMIINGAVSPELSFDQTTPGTTNVIQEMTMSSSGQTATLLNALRLVGTHYPTNGVFASNGNYTIASTASSTANIAAGATGGGYITGDVIVERFIPMNQYRAWRLLSVPATGKTIHQTWQEGQGTAVNGTPGYGTAITSNLTSFATDGCDYKTPYNSLLSYNPSTDAFVGVTNTNVPIADEPGYFIYIRGNRLASPSAIITGNNSETTLRITGELKNGDQAPISVGANQWAMIGNPYASAIDLRKIVTSGGCANTSFSIWDPKVGGSYNLGSYQTITWNGSSYVAVPGGGSYTPGNPNYIESGAAFFVYAFGSTGTVTIYDTSKASGSNMVFRPASTLANKNLVTNLYAVNGSKKDLADGNLVLFDDNFSNSVDGLDNLKNYQMGENLCIVKGNSDYVVERRQVPTGNDTINFSMYSLKRMSYQLQILGDQLDQPNMAAFLEDKYLNTSTALRLNDTTNYTFAVTSVAASNAVNRFRIVFKPISVLPVVFTSIKATQQTGKVAVEWAVSNQLNIRQYSIEKSTNGREFASVGSQVAIGVNGSSQTYNWLDVNPANGFNYYRIKSVDANGGFKYTSIVKVTLGKGTPSFTISPNPVEGNTVNLQFANQPIGNYNIRLVNNSGQIVYRSTKNHAGGSATQIMELPSSVAKGAYQLEIIAPDSSRQIQKLLIK